jgi:hypothetical protein
MPEAAGRTAQVLPQPDPREEPRLGGFTARAIFLGLVLMTVNIWWVTVVEVRWYTLDSSCLPLFITPVFILFLVTVLNLAVRRLAPRSALTQAELLVMYVMMVVSMTLCGHDTLQNMFGTIGHPYQFATPENGYEDLFLQYLPNWLVVSDKDALDAFYDGGMAWYRPEYLRAWAAPLLAWGAFIAVIIVTMLCINIIIRKEWTEHEKLAFPLVLLPLELTRGERTAQFFRSKFMWGGFAVAAVIDLINGFHALFPAVPEIPYIKLYDLRQHFRARPWNAIGRTRMGMYPFAVGLAFFLPSDLSFSCWFFYVLSKVELIGCALIGRESLKGLPYLNEQAAGAWLALAVVAVWTTRFHLGHVLRKVLGRPSPLDDSQEPITYRMALVLMGLGFAFIVGFCTAAGMHFWPIVGFFAIYYMMSLAMTRVRAELGSPHETYFVNPHRILAGIGNTRAFAPRDLTIMATMYWFNRCYRSHPMPNQLEAFKMAQQSMMDRRRLFAVLLLASVAAIIATYWANLAVTYDAGAAAKARGFKSWLGRESYDGFLRPWLLNPTGTQWLSVVFMAIGAALIVALKGLRTRFVGLPFHPAGYALAISFAMDYFWFAFFVSWLLKVTIMRYWGMKAHRQGVWVCLGLIMGDYFLGSLWAIVGPVFQVANYKIFI